MKRIYLIISGLIFFCLTCNKQEYHNVPDQYKPNLKQGDTLIYSNGIKFDSFILYSIYSIDLVEDKKHHREEIWYSFKNPTSKLHSRIILFSDYYAISLEEFYSSGSSYSNSNDTQLVINNKLYSPVYKIPMNPYSDTSKTIIRQSYYNYKLGVVRYITKSNDTFNIMNK